MVRQRVIGLARSNLFIGNKINNAILLVVITSYLLLAALTPLVGRIIGSIGSAHAFTGTGSGTAVDPFLIADCDELQSIDLDGQNYETETKHYHLANDIDCTATSGWNSGLGFNPIDNFEGIFDGNGHTINGLTINRPTEYNTALFEEISGSGLVARLNLTNVSITGDSYVGALAGETNGTLLDIHISGTVTGENDQYYMGVGGFAGRKGNPDTSVSRVSFEGTVTNTGSTTGGLFGFAGNVGILTDSYVDADVTGQDDTGGLIGRTGACCNIISNTYAIGSVTGVNNVGGLIGSYQNANSEDNGISDSFAATTVNGSSYIGAVIGLITNIGTTGLTNISFDQDVASFSVCVGSSDSGVIECTARNTDGLNPGFLQDSANEPLASWDFTNVWSEGDAAYPSLQPVTELTTPGVVSNISVAFPSQPNEAEFSFDPPADTGSFPLREYEVEVRLASGSWSNLVDSNSSSSTPVNIYNLQLGTDYVARVRAVSAYGGGSWVEYNFSTEPPVNRNISSCEQLRDIDETAFYLDNITLTQDIDCSSVTDFTPLDFNNSYGGVFDGQGYTISNLTIDRTVEDTSYAAIFYYAEEATFKDVTISDSTFITPYEYAGALVAEAEDISVENVHARNVVVEAAGDGYAGGLIGVIWYGYSPFEKTLTNLSSTGEISGSDDVGGLIGELEVRGPADVTVSKSFSSANVSDTTGDSDYINFGGLIGDVEVFGDDDDQVSSLTITDNYAKGNVSGTGSVGGLIGDATIDSDGYSNNQLSLTINRNYSSGEVTAIYNEAGGLIGNIQAVYDADQVFTLSNNFTSGSVGAEAEEGGIVGWYEIGDAEVVSSNNYYDSSDISVCSPLAELDDCTAIDEADNPNYFKNNTTNPPLDTWNFNDVWLVNGGYPLLRDMPSDSSGSDEGLPIGSAEDSTLILLEQTGCDGFGEWQTLKESDLTVRDAGFVYPKGFVEFELLGCTTGGSATITVTFTGDYEPSDVSIRKHNKNTGAYTTLSQQNANLNVARTTLESKPAIQATYTITDGGDLDQDGVVNGVIEDPVGLGTLSVGSPNTGLKQVVK